MANQSTIGFTAFPRTQPPPSFTQSLIEVFVQHESKIATERLDKGLTSDQVLAILASDLAVLGFEVETGKSRLEKIDRPVFFGELGKPTLRYEIDAYSEEWKCGLEVEAGRSWMGNAVYRDLIQASIMVGIDYLCLAVPNAYKYKSKGKTVINRSYENTRGLAEAVFGHSRITLPYSLVLIGY